MSLVHRFSAKYISSPQRLFADDEKLRRHIAAAQKKTGLSEIAKFLDSMHRKQGTIKAALLQPGMAMRKQLIGDQAIMGNSTKANWFQNALIKVAVVPQAKLFAHCNYTLAVHEEKVLGHKHRLTLRFESPHTSQLLAASDDVAKASILAVRADAKY